MPRHALPNASPLVDVRQQIQAQAAALMAGHHCVFLGGDHSVTLPLLRAARAQHGALALVHFDAHCDTWTDHFGEPSGHGTWTYEAITEGLVSPQHTVQIGLRSSGERAAREYVQDQGGLIFTARQLRGIDGAGLAPVIEQIRTRLGSRPCYLTLDIDCLDPAFAPGTGTPEPGGLSSSQVLTFLEGLAPLNMIGMDCVEVAPAYDHAELTSSAAATLVWTYLCGQVAKVPLDCLKVPFHVACVRYPTEPEKLLPSQRSACPRAAASRRTCNADVVVVGAGFAGLSAAIELAQRGYQVVVLEADRVCSGASGRNGGQAIVGFSGGQEPFETQFGQAARRRLAWDMTVRRLDLIDERITKAFQIECDHVNGYLYLADSRRKARALESEIDGNGAGLRFVTRVC